MIEGAQEAYDILRRYPDRCNKLIRKALQKAVQPTVKDIRRNVPIKDAQKLAKAKVKSNKDFSYIKYGLYGPKRIAGDSKITPWFKAYWKNYGTLTHRDPNHNFVYPIRKSRKRKNNVGQKAENFFDKTIENRIPQMEKIFVQTVVELDKKEKL